MTRQEAIDILVGVIATNSEEENEALDVAIEELEQIESGRYVKGECSRCSEKFGTLGCCSTVSNHWVYSCKEGMTQYAEGLEQKSMEFYYVESLDDYWVGRRLGNFYYANWHRRFGFIWSHSKYLPWGEHVVDENTWWKEYTYPSEPKEIPFTEWIIGFTKKYFQQELKRGKWIRNDNGTYSCNLCQSWIPEEQYHYARFCLQCGVRMESDEQ